MKKKHLSLVILGVLALAMMILTGCGGGKGVTIAVPNDTTNEARALILLQDNGLIKLKDGKDITATIKDVEEANGITFKEVEAAQIPNTLKDVDFGIINSNYAIDAKLK